MTAKPRWICRRPHLDGAEACIRDTNINVWGLVEWRRQGLSDEDILAAVQGLTRDDLVAAWSYSAEHLAEIEEAIQRNAEA
jgi:uncharacterized protein (DUF433 family)